MRPPPRVALVSQHFLLDGSIPRCHVELTRQLLRRGYDVHVFSAATGIDRE